MINIEKLTATNYFKFLGVILNRDFPIHKVIEKENDMEIILGTNYGSPEIDVSAEKYKQKNYTTISKYFSFEKSITEIDELIYIKSKISEDELLDVLFSVYVIWKYEIKDCYAKLYGFNPENFILGFNQLNNDYIDKVNNFKEFGISEIKVAKVNNNYLKIRVLNSSENIDFGYSLKIG